MDLMQGQNNWLWFLVEAALCVLSIAFIWYLTMIGRDRKPNVQRRGEERITSYGEVEEEHSPLPKFLIITYVLFGIWAVIYLISTGMYGLY